MLAIAEYAYNNSKHSTTKISPFYINYRFEKQKNWLTDDQLTNPAPELSGHYMMAVLAKLSTQLEQ